LKPGTFHGGIELSPSASVSSVSVGKANGESDDEIFAVYGGERVQVTSNQDTDAFPSKDLGGHSVVWQGMQGGRWQIFLATFASGTPQATQITASSENNFNPRVEGSVVVWQTWMNDNWEIVVAQPHVGEPRKEGDIPEMNRILGVNPDWDVTRITMNPAHDMFPSIQGNIITWQRSEDGAWTVYAYSLSSGVTTMVSRAGAKSENPRFTLVYEEEDVDGVRRLVGYDIASGDRIDLTEEAKHIPDRNKPYVPNVPVDGEQQAALPATGTSTSRTSEEGDTGPDLPPDEI
jgi:hypothetical protein